MAKISRRVAIAALGLVGVTGGRGAAAAPPADLELAGTVLWCDCKSGILSFAPERPDARKHMIKVTLRGDDDVALLKTHRWADVRIRYAWEPNVDVRVPWQAKEIILENAGRLPAQYS